MKTKYYQFSFLSFLIICSCQKQKEPITIKPFENEISAFSVEVQSTIKLSDDPKALIGEITSCLYKDQRIYILDTYSILGVSIFDINGELIYRSKKGKGPGELIYPYSMFFNNDQLVIAENHKLSYYDFLGNYLKRQDLPPGFFARNYEWLKNGNVIVYGASPKMEQNQLEDKLQATWYRYHLYDSTLSQSINHFIPTPIDYAPLECDKPLSSYNHHVLLLSRPDNFIYTLNNNDIQQKYYVDFGEYTFTKEDISKGKFSLSGQIRNKERQGLLDNLYETRDFIVFSYCGCTGIECVVYSKQNRISCSIHNILKANDLPKMKVVGVYDNSIICAMDPERIDEERLKAFNNLGIIPSEITSESNYVIFIIKITVN